MTSFAESLVGALEDRGTRHLFGVPGGGSSLDLIEACGRVGIEFVLTRGETAATMMAATAGELTGAPGAALAGVGPGAASAVNGMAYAQLERAPLVLFTDRVADEPERPTWHQRFDQPALFRPVAKAACRLEPAMAPAELAALLDLPGRHPQGPVHVDLTPGDARHPGAPLPRPAVSTDGTETLPPEIADRAAAAKRPVLIVGLQARAAAREVRALAARWGAACLTTYKAKGVIADADPLLVAQFTGGTAEAAVLHEADLIVLVGHDPVEMIPSGWSYAAPVVALATWDWRVAGGYPKPAAIAVGDIAALAERLTAVVRPGEWHGRPAELRAAYRQRIAYPAVAGIAPDTVIDLAQALAAPGARLAVDAGAHMFSTLARWQAGEPFGVLKSNGLSTMGYALPAAIGSALTEPARPVVAVTGDGGMMMSLGELATAAEHRLDIVLIVLNDGALSLIDVKQQKQQRPRAGVDGGVHDFAAVARGFGWNALTIDEPATLMQLMVRAFELPRPCLVDVRIDASGYGAQLDAMRG